MSFLLKPEKIFLIFAIFFGLLILFVTPPFQSADENAHFLRIYGISQGQFVPTKSNNNSGTFLPASLSKLEAANKFDQLRIMRNEKISAKQILSSSKFLDTEEKVFLNYSNTSLYSPIAYTPQLTGIKIAQFFSHSLLFMMIFAKLFNLIFYITICYFAVKSIPFLKWASVIVLLSPMNLSLAASLSTDPVLLSCSTLFFAKVLQYSFDKENKINWKQVCFLSILAIIIALVKQSVLLVFLILVIPKERFGNKYFEKISAIILPAFLFSFVWAIFASSFYSPQHNANPNEQIKFIIQNPLNYCFILMKTICLNWYRWIVQSIGVLGWLNLTLWGAYFMYPIVLLLNTIFAYDTAHNKFLLPKNNKIIIISVILINVIFILTSTYISWTPAGIRVIEGVQGRYFAPLILPFLAMITLSLKENKTTIIIQNVTIISLLAILIYTVSMIYFRFIN